MLLEAEQGADHHSTRGDICPQSHLEQQDWNLFERRSSLIASLMWIVICRWNFSYANLGSKCHAISNLFKILLIAAKVREVSIRELKIKHHKMKKKFILPWDFRLRSFNHNHNLNYMAIAPWDYGAKPRLFQWPNYMHVEILHYLR